MNAFATLMRMTMPSIATLIVLASLAGCADQVEKDQHRNGGSISDRQDAAMKDPFSYGPAEGKTSGPVDPAKAKRDTSFKGDSDRFWNP